MEIPLTCEIEGWGTRKQFLVWVLGGGIFKIGFLCHCQDLCIKFAVDTDNPVHDYFDQNRTFKND